VATLSTITDANKDELCTSGCVDALKKFGEDYSTCNPQMKPCSQTKGKDECTINPAGIFEKKCPTNSDCSVKPGIKFETGDCDCTSSSKPCWDTNACVENPDYARVRDMRAIIDQALGYAKLDANCQDSQLKCCPGKSLDQCKQTWCDSYFTPACIPKAQWCYSQVGLAVGGPIVALVVISVIVVIIVVIQRKNASRWGRAGTGLLETNNPARFM